MMKTLIICESIHHGNTLKLAKAIASELGAVIKKPAELKITDLGKYDLIGFGSGIYDDKHHKLIFDAIDRMPVQKGKKVFICSTSGVPVKILGKKFLDNYTKKCHRTLNDKLTSKGFKSVGEFSCPGFNTNVFLKYIGGLNKGRPNEEDLEGARRFASKITS